MQQNIRSGLAILADLEKGRVAVQLSQAIHDAMGAAKIHGKAAQVTLTLDIRPPKEVGDRMVETPMFVAAEVTTKLPKPTPLVTLFYLDADGNATRQPTREQDDLPFSVASSQSQGGSQS